MERTFQDRYSVKKEAATQMDCSLSSLHFETEEPSLCFLFNGYIIDHIDFCGAHPEAFYVFACYS